MAVSYMEQMEWVKSSNMFRKVSEEHSDSELAQSARILSEKVKGGDDIPTKSSLFAGVLSLIPGLGQAYTEHWWEAFTTAVINVVLGYTVYSLWDTEIRFKEEKDRNLTAVYLIGGVETIFYLANIYGAVISADRFNRMSKRKFLEQLRSELLSY
jgi:TM2 domain-containing membrane protein YozV